MTNSIEGSVAAPKTNISYMPSGGKGAGVALTAIAMVIEQGIRQSGKQTFSNALPETTAYRHIADRHQSIGHRPDWPRSGLSRT